MVRSAARRLGAMLVVGMVSHAAAAADLRNVLTDYTVTSWSQREGLPPGNVWALAQDHQGYLWVGSDGGLLRFDGLQFTRWSLENGEQPSKPVRSLYTSLDGSLWVGFGDEGGITRIRPDSTKSFGPADGLPAAAILALIEDSSGTIWAGGEKGLFSLVSGRWEKWPGDRGLPDAAVYSVLIDRSGGFYVGAASGVFVRRAGASRYEQVEALDTSLEQSTTEGLSGRFQRSLTEDASGRVHATVSGFPRSLVQDPLGRVLVNDWNLGFRTAGGKNDGIVSTQRGRGYRLLFDRRQNLWVGTIGQGLWRIHLGDKSRAVETDRATSLTGLLSDGIGSLLEDSEGNVWAGTTEGLSRLTPRRISQLTNEGIVVGIDMAPDRSVWVGTDSDLMRFLPGNSETPVARIPLPGAGLRAMHVDRGGTVWVATERGLARLAAGQSTLTPVATPGIRYVELIASDLMGGLWLYGPESGLARWNDNVITRFPLPASISDVRFGVLFTDRTGRLWASLSDGRVAIFDRAGDARVYGADAGLNAGICRQIFEDDEGAIWVAATGGLSRFADDRFVTVRADHGFPVSDLTAIIEDDVHDLWIGTGFGILRIARRDFNEVAEGRASTMRYSSYRRSDGLAGLPHAYNSNRRVVRASDGKLWFVTSRGLSLIDPPAFRAVPRTPPLTVEYVTANEQRLKAANGLKLSAQTSRLEIAYSELNLSSPLRTRFRHRLEGFDAGWVDAAARRSAFYTNLPPRSYTFRVQASAPDGAWTEPGAMLEFSIAPRFYQTMGFRAATVLVIGLGVWGIWQLRLRQMRRQFTLLLGERVRLSRELHDTLLQNLVGMALQFDAIAADVESTAPGMQKRFVRMRKQVEEYIREARQSIWDLRFSRNQRRDLVAALREIGEHATASGDVHFDLAVHGEPRPYAQNVEEQLLRIGQEAVNNAVRHAGARRIHAQLHYHESSVALHVIDDGCGFDVAAATDAAAGHYGLTTMRERAEEIGAALDVDSQPNRGTEVRAMIASEV